MGCASTPIDYTGSCNDDQVTFHSEYYNATMCAYENKTANELPEPPAGFAYVTEYGDTLNGEWVPYTYLVQL